MKHNRTPWRIVDRTTLISKNEIVITQIKGFSTTDKQDRINALFIKRACNNHYKLVEALENLTLAIDNESDETLLRESFHKAKALIKKARGKNENN